MFAAVQVAFEKADAQRTQFRNNMMAHHAQRFCRMAGDEDALSLGQQVPNEVSDGVRLSRAWRALNQHATVLLELLGNANLLGIRGFAEKNLGVGFTVTIGRRIRFSSVSGRGDSSPTILRSDQGKSSRVRRSARMPSIAAAYPRVRARRNRIGSRPIRGSLASAAGARSSSNSPRGES